MKTFLLVIVLTATHVPDVEQHVAIITPDESTCIAMRDAYVYSTMMNLTDDEHVVLNVEQVTCEEHIDEQAT